MNETNIFNNWLELDCFCLDIAEAWIKYRQYPLMNLWSGL